MESKLFAAFTAAAGLAAGWFWGRRGARPAGSRVPDEERLAWLQRLSTVGQMMSSVIHEVRTPLNTVILAVEHASKMLARGGDPREQLETVAREADRAVSILSDILDFAKPSPLDLRPVDLSVVLEAALQLQKIRFAERGVETILTAPEELRVLASERHLFQVLTVLLINALDAMPFGGRLEARAARRDQRVVATITDTGIGIEAGALKSLFEPFATGRAESGGTGLGLNVARWIMHKHGGDVSIASRGIGKGTTVTLTLKASD
ncbi:MAG: hypothetical protein A2V88_12040 [Elusimicrobia bacterium RBG_16_66_12]|nr:MAG: hypothetical protein A2V88_12040 [Elusimicrobia bacterium RBG_16_66_12]